MRRLRLLLFTLFIMFIPVLLYSQPSCIFHLYGGLILPTGQLGTNPSFIPSDNYYLENNYGMKLGINLLAVDFKLAVDKERHIRGVLGYNGNIFFNPKEILNVIGMGVTVIRKNIEIHSFQLGGEYAFTPKEKYCPFVGGAFTGNFISGDDFSSQVRYGLRLTCGVDITVKNKFGTVVGISFDIANLIGKSTNINTLQYGTPHLPLNDDEFTLEGNTVKSKTISYFNFFLGFSLFLGQPDK